PREGPGDFESTKKAFSLMNNHPEKPKILDIGSGPGKQTLDLAKLCNGFIYAVDLHLPYLEELNKIIRDTGLSSRVFTDQSDMNSLIYKNEYFDIIWAEGSIYIIGFENGLKSWRKYLKKNGYMAVTEVSWLKKDPPKELINFWNREYPNIKYSEENLSIIKNVGYEVIDSFVLPENAWWDDYYNNIEQKLSQLRVKYKDDKEVIEVLENEQSEIDMYRKYSSYYGYVFYIMKKM
ncbi:class I SAM-dependent methyltransferase, partial [Bacteroidota bacterium]